MGKYTSEEVNPIDCCKKCASINECDGVCLITNNKYCDKDSCIPGECVENGKFILTEDKNNTYQWNDEKIKRHYNRTLEDAKRSRYDFTDEELDHPYLDKLSHQTKSSRIMRMVTLAYYLGKLKGIREIDEGKTSIVLS